VNEAASAELATAVLGPLRVAPAVIDATRRLILTTIEHRAGPGDIDAGVLTDADLWILGAPRDRYRRYVEAVRQEYGWLDDAAWCAGRSAVLVGFLDRARIYLTDRAHTAFDGSARRNLAAELATLGGGEAKA
jgi:predicted metal-dependent HD superfamily phosphohydrolase